MFAPGFFTGQLIKRFGVMRIMAVGVALNALCIAVALTGVDLHRFLIALFLARRGLELPVHGGDDAVAAGVCPGGEGPGAGGAELLCVRGAGGDVVCVGVCW